MPTCLRSLVATIAVYEHVFVCILHTRPVYVYASGIHCLRVNHYVCVYIYIFVDLFVYIVHMCVYVYVCVYMHILIYVCV